VNTAAGTDQGRPGFVWVGTKAAGIHCRNQSTRAFSKLFCLIHLWNRVGIWPAPVEQPGWSPKAPQPRTGTRVRRGERAQRRGDWRTTMPPRVLERS